MSEWVEKRRDWTLAWKGKEFMIRRGTAIRTSPNNLPNGLLDEKVIGMIAHLDDATVGPVNEEAIRVWWGLVSLEQLSMIERRLGGWSKNR